MTASFSLRDVKSSWSTDDVRMLRELSQRDLTIDAIAKLMRRSESAVRNKATMHGIPMRRSSSGRTHILGEQCQQGIREQIERPGRPATAT